MFELPETTRKVRHVLLSASYENDENVLGADITESVRETLTRNGAEPIGAVVYTTNHFIPAHQVSLVEAWIALSDEQRKRIHDDTPNLFTAIFLALKGIYPDPAGVEVI